MREQDHIAIVDAMAELSHLENRSGRAEPMRVAIAQMCAGALFIEAQAGKQRADQVIGALWRSQLQGDPVPQRFPRPRRQT
ncbi:hypothetical protein [Mesorhizobium sp. WSM3859]|uniref:hypothetical protein n=1 Tax=Mesorhizobium sp. WSM3859 TaxID=2029402 RepID=UPI000BB049AB|nr:hypothetical protein [Mesorhizobium sp. WSM3859]PBC08205.1 hypothetical protein CK230_22100 [Mesorhizobium sp. WSM3859]